MTERILEMNMERMNAQRWHSREGTAGAVCGGMDGPCLSAVIYMKAEMSYATEVNNQYLYNGKELNTDFGLDWLDYGFRWYDASIARWHSVDPRAEKYFDNTPYNYVLNNPILNIDPRGDTTRVYNDIGVLQNTINDSHANEDHFFESDNMLAFLGILNSDSKADGVGEFARELSSFFIGANTRKELSDIENASDEYEQGFLLVPGEDRELDVVDITDEGTSTSSQAGLTFSPPDNVPDEGQVGGGHTHPNSSSSPSATLNRTSDYQSWAVRGSNKKPSHLAVIAGGNSFTIHPTASRVYHSGVHRWGSWQLPSGGKNANTTITYDGKKK